MHEFCFLRTTADLGDICMKKKMHESFGIETIWTFQKICSTFTLTFTLTSSRIPLLLWLP